METRNTVNKTFTFTLLYLHLDMFVKAMYICLDFFWIFMCPKMNVMFLTFSSFFTIQQNDGEESLVIQVINPTILRLLIFFCFPLHHLGAL